MADAGIDIGAYFARIGYDGAASPLLSTLRAVQLCHAQTIPFENLNPFIGWPVRLDPASLQQKLVREGRGGYCFEHNLLFSHVLRGIGFEVRWLAARVIRNLPDNTVGARTHMVLLVTLDVPYIVDVGFGGLTLTAPLKLETDVEQTTPHEPCRLIRIDDEFMVQSKIAGEWRSLYRFGLQEQLLPDYELCNWYLSNHPQSHFVVNLVAARPDADRRHALRNNDLAVHHLDGRTERRALRSVAELRRVLSGVFRVTLPDFPQLDEALARVISIGTASAPGASGTEPSAAST
jgi:N-hydroxyarylamine O-acetyltransferase